MPDIAFPLLLLAVCSVLWCCGVLSWPVAGVFSVLVYYSTRSWRLPS